MIILSNGTHNIKRKLISQGIEFWSGVRNLNPKGLAYRINCSEDYIKKVINCEHIDIKLEFLQDVVMVLNPPGGRKLSPEDVPEILSLEDCLIQLEVPTPSQPKLL